MPALEGPQISGVPTDPHGFIPVSAYGEVRGLDGVYAAGDVTARPIKHGGLAAEQADVVASAIASRAGVAVEPHPLEHVIRGALMTGRETRLLEAVLGDDGAYRSKALGRLGRRERRARRRPRRRSQAPGQARTTSPRARPAHPRASAATRACHHPSAAPRGRGDRCRPGEPTRDRLARRRGPEMLRDDLRGVVGRADYRRVYGPRAVLTLAVDDELLPAGLAEAMIATIASVAAAADISTLLMRVPLADDRLLGLLVDEFGARRRCDVSYVDVELDAVATCGHGCVVRARYPRPGVACLSP